MRQMSKIEYFWNEILGILKSADFQSIVTFLKIIL
jgi:hypothetical protein